MTTIRIFLLVLTLFVSAGSLAVTAHATYSSSDVYSIDGNGGYITAPHCGPGGSATSGNYYTGSSNPADYPPGFFDNPDHYCFWETEKVVNQCAGCAEDTVNNSGWQVFPSTWNPVGNGNFCGQAAPAYGGLRDMCWTTGFRVYTPTASLSASPSSITSGQTSVLSWSSTHATSCTSSDFSTGGATSGTFAVAPGVTKTYTVTCSGSSGSANASATVTVTAAAQSPTASLSASPSSVSSGGSSLLTWSSTNATSCTGTGFSTGSATSGSVSTGALSSSKSYSVTCTGAGGTASAATSVTVNSSAFASLTVSSASITQGQTISMGWTCSDTPANGQNILSSMAGDSYGTVNGTGSGSISWTPQGTGTRTYTLNCYTNSSGILSDSKSVTVNVASAAPVVSLTANPNTITSGQSTTLTWSSSNATSCTSGTFATGNATSGTASVSPASSQWYSVTCTGPGGSTTANALVTVNGGYAQSTYYSQASYAPPTTCGTGVAPTITAAPTIVKQGSTSTISWSATGVTAGTSCAITGANVGGAGVNSVTSSAADSSCTVATGTKTPTISGQTTFTITCGGASKAVLVNVVPTIKEF